MDTKTQDRGWTSLESYAREAREIVADVTECARCGHDGADRRLEVHHVDGDPTNNARGNLRKLCSACHGAEHSAGDKGRCRVQTCDRKVYARGSCQKHYMRWYRARKQGMTRVADLDPGELPPDAGPEPEHAPTPDTCQEAGCDADHYARGRCYNHYQQDYRRRRRERFLG